MKTPASDEIVLIGETNFRNQKRRFGIKRDDRRRHVYFIGKTGMGKSTVMENMIVQDIVAGRGVAVVDPHGDLVEKVLDFIPSFRVNDVVYLNPSDVDYPIAFNVMEKVDSKYKPLVASGLIGVYKKIWADSWGPRLEYVLRNTILALLDYPGSTLLGITRMLVDKEYRRKVIEKITDPVIKSFWVDEYSKYPDKFQVEAISPIQNKVGQFLSIANIRNIVGQSQSTIDMRDIMDKRKILLLNLSKGRIGEDASALLGAMMITKIQLAAMGRVDVPEKEREDFYLYVDEFQNFATESFANILSEARKYRLNLIIAHQYIEQLNEVVQPAVFGNVGTIVCYRVGATDAEFLAKEFAPQFTETDLVNLTKYDTYMKLMIDGVASEPFSATTLPPLPRDMQTGNREKVIAVSRERYANPRTEVEERITRWSGMTIGEVNATPNVPQHSPREPSTIRQTEGAPLKRSHSNERAASPRMPPGPTQPPIPRPAAPHPPGAVSAPEQPNVREQAPQSPKKIPEPKHERPVVREEPPALEPVAVPPPQTISLHEALRREPISFAKKKGTPHGLPDAQAMRGAGDFAPPQEKREPPQPPPQPPSRPELPPRHKEQRAVQPNEVVRFP